MSKSTSSLKGKLSPIPLDLAAISSTRALTLCVLCNRSKRRPGDCRKKLAIVCRVAGVLCAVTLIIIGIVGLIGSPSVKQLVDSLFFIVFGVLFIVAEARVQIFLHYFGFLKRPLGLSMSYFFVGFRAIGWPWWSYIIIALAFAPGLFYLCIFLTCGSLYDDGDEEAGYQGLPSGEGGAEKGLIADDILAQAAMDATLAAAQNPAIRQAAMARAKQEIAEGKGSSLLSNNPLPPGWSAKVDEGSGTTYYVNAQTGENRWDRPEW